MKRGDLIWIVPLLWLALAGCGGHSGLSGFTGGGGAHARGQVVRPDYGAETFAIQPLVDWSGFQPVGDSVEVHTGAGTRFLDRGGATMTPQQWYEFVAMNAGPSTAAHAKGDYTAGRIEADEVRLE